MTITAPPSISALPTPPDPNDRATFNTRAYPWSVAQQTLATEVGAVATNVYNNALEAADLATTASAQVALASAAANYKGLWSSLSGALNMPATVSHNGNFWALNANLANVATATPGVSSSWQPLNVGSGGAAETSSAVDITLTAASYRVQAVTMTAADKSVILPDATTLSTGGELFVVKNSGNYAFCLRDATGVLLAKLSPGQCAGVHLVNAGLSAGVWALTGDGLADTIYQNTAQAVTSTTSGLVGVAALSPTTAVAAWYNASGFVSACVLTISGTTVSAGPVLTTGAVAYNALRFKIVAMSATQAVVVYGAVTTGYLSAMTLNVSGTTVTAGAAMQVSATLASYTDVVKMSSTQAVVVYNGSSNYGEARTLNISGTTITAGAALTAYSVAVQSAAAATLSPTQLVAIYSASGGVSNVVLLSVSGTGITVANGPVTAAGGITNAAVAVSETQVLCLGIHATYSYPRWSLVDTTSGVVTIKDVQDSFGQENPNALNYLVNCGTGRVLALRAPMGGGTNNNRAALQSIRVADALIKSPAPLEVIKNAWVTGYTVGAIAALSSSMVIVAYVDSNSYVQAKVVEVAQ